MWKVIKLIALCLVFAIPSIAQNTYSIPTDTLKVFNLNPNKGAELNLFNSTRGVKGFLYNKGFGRTEFKIIQLANLGDTAIAIIGQDTIQYKPGGGSEGSDSIILTNFPLTKSVLDNIITLGLDTSANGVTTSNALRDTLRNILAIDTSETAGGLFDLKPQYGILIQDGNGTILVNDAIFRVDTACAECPVSKPRLNETLENFSTFDSTGFIQPSAGNAIKLTGPGKVLHPLEIALQDGIIPIDTTIDLDSIGIVSQVNDHSGAVMLSLSGTDSTVVLEVNGDSVSMHEIKVGGSGNGDMLKSVYDPTGVEDDAFDYNNLHNKPTIPAQFHPIGGTGITLSGTYPNITFNGFSGSYDDLTDKPTIPQINDGASSTTSTYSSDKINDLISNAGGGTVTSVGLSVPTGFSVSNSPVTTSGTLGLTFASGYSLPSNTEQAVWDDKADPSDIKDNTITISAGGIATGGGNFTLNQGSNKTITVSVPATDLDITGTTGARTITSSTGDDASIPLATTAASGLLSPSDKVKLNNLPAANTNLANTELSLPSEGTRSFDINGGSLTFLDNTIGPYTPNLLFLDNKNVIMTVGDPDAIGYTGVSITNHATNGFSPTISLTTQTQDNGGVTYSLDSVKFNWTNERVDGSHVNIMDLDTAGNVTIQGHLTAIGGGSNGSDIRLKDTLSMEPLHVINQLHTVMFRYKPGLGLGDKLHIGYIAQEVEKYMPSVVGSTDSGIKTVDYEQVHTAAINDLIQIVKKQQKQIDALKQKVEQLKRK